MGQQFIAVGEAGDHVDVLVALGLQSGGGSGDVRLHGPVLQTGEGEALRQIVAVTAGEDDLLYMGLCQLVSLVKYLRLTASTITRTEQSSLVEAT